MEAIIKATQSGSLSGVTPALVISSKEKSGGILKAKALGISEENIVVLNPKMFETDEEFGKAIINECKSRKVDFIGQYGWLVKTPENVISEYSGMIVNQHPAPLDTGRPDFGGPGMYGVRDHETRLCFVRKTNRDFWTEATAHIVTVEYDKGVVVKRKKVAILPDDTAETLQARVLPVEHEVQIDTIRDFVNNTVKILTREKPLVLQGEEGILEECKKSAIEKYSKK